MSAPLDASTKEGRVQVRGARGTRQHVCAHTHTRTHTAHARTHAQHKQTGRQTVKPDKTDKTE